MMKSDASAYPLTKYEEWLPGAYRSARIILPSVVGLIGPSSVVDVGCGVGAWLRVCSDLGISVIRGIDGDYVPRNLLQIPEMQFSAVELHSKWPELGQFDLALCLETAEHLDPEAAEGLIANLASVSQVIVFSAAIPFQGGDDHRNEQWPDYWVAKFTKHGYVSIDCIRPSIADESSVEWWYRQNIFVAASPSAIAVNPLLAQLAERHGPPMRRVTWECYESNCNYWKHLANTNGHSLSSLVANAGKRIIRGITNGVR